MKTIVSCLLGGIALSLSATTVTLDFSAVKSPRLGMRTASVSDESQTGAWQLTLANPDALATLSVGDTLGFSLADADVSFSLVLTATEGAGAVRGWRAAIGGMECASVFKGTRGWFIDISDLATGLVYHLRQTDGSTWTVTRSDPSLKPITYGEPLTPPPPANTNAQKRAAFKAAAAEAVSELRNLDVLFAFDAGAKAYIEETKGSTLVEYAAQQIATMNSVMANSKLDDKINFRYVGTVSVAASETSLQSALNAATYGSSGWSAIADARDEYGADLVSVSIDTGSEYGVVGLGWALPTVDPEYVAGYGDVAYHAISVRSAYMHEVEIHEAGHNLGAGHSNLLEADAQSAPYSFGYYFTNSLGTIYHTIMAYNSHPVSGSYCLPCHLFSSPDLTYGSVEPKPVAGTPTNDNRRVLLQTYAAASEWRDEVEVPEDDPGYDEEVLATFHGFGTRTDGGYTATIDGGTIRFASQATWDGNTNGVSVLVRYSGYAQPSANAFLVTLKSSNVGNGAENAVGVFARSTDGTIHGVWDNNTWTGKDGDSSWVQVCDQTLAKEGYMILTYKGGSGTILYDEEGVIVYKATKLMTAKNGQQIGDLITVGSESATMEIEGVRIFKGTLSADEIAAAVEDFEDSEPPDEPTYDWTKWCEDESYTSTPLAKDVTAGKQIKVAFKGVFSESDVASAQLASFQGDTNDIDLNTDESGYAVLTLHRKTSQDYHSATSTVAIAKGEHQFGLFVRRGTSSGGHVVSIVVTMDGKQLVALGDNRTLTFDINPMRKLYLGDAEKTGNVFTSYYVEPETAVDDDTETIKTLITDVKVLFGSENPKVCGAACLYDWTFTNAVERTGSKSIAAACGSQQATAMKGDNDAHYANFTNGLYTALKSYVRPYAKVTISGGQSVAYYGTASAQTNTVLFALGTSGGSLFLATGANTGEIILGRTTAAGDTVAASTLKTITGVKQPNDIPHLYVLHLSSDMLTATVTIDGSQAATHDFSAVPTVNAGIQINGMFSGMPTNWKREETEADCTCAMNCLRVFDHELAAREHEALMAEFKPLWEDYNLAPDRTLVLTRAFGSALNVANGLVTGPTASTLAFDIGKDVVQEITGSTSDSARHFTIKVLSGVLNFTGGGGSTAFRGRTVAADGDDAVIRLSAGDATGYSYPGVKIALANGGMLEVGKRDTLCTPVELDGGIVKLMSGCANNSGRGLDLFDGNGNDWTVSGDSALTVEAGADANDKKVHLRKGDWNVDIAEGGILTVDANIVTTAGGDGTRGNLVKTGAGTLVLNGSLENLKTTLAAYAGQLVLANNAIGGSLVADGDAVIDISLDGEVADNTVLLTASSVELGSATLRVNGKVVTDMYFEGGKLIAGKPPITTCLNPYAVKDGDDLKVSSNTDLTQAGYAYDGDTSTYFQPTDAANAEGVSWTGIEFTNGVIVTRVAYSGNYARRMIGGVFQGANANDFSDAETIHVVEEYTGGTSDVMLEEAKGPYKYLRFVGMYGGNVSEIEFYGLADSGANAPTNAPEVTASWSTNGVAGLTLKADAAIPQVYVIQRAMRDFCEDESDYETCATLAPQLGIAATWVDSEATGYAMYRVRGLNANGASGWTYFEIEPEALIDGPAKPEFVGDKPGFYAANATVTITYGNSNAKIYYTLDGSTPTTNSTEYTEPIALADVCSKTNELCNIPTNPSQLQGNDAYGWRKPTADQPNVSVIRARAFLPDGSASTNEIAGTWMIGPTVSEALTNGLRVVSVITDKDNFFGDPKGIMVPGDIYNENGYGSGGVGQPNANYFQRGQAWERPAFIEMFDENGGEMFSAKMGTRVHGNWSRASAKKTLVCYSRKELGAKNIKKQLFNDEPDHKKFKRFSLRNGGNDWYKVNLRDAVGQSMFRGFVSTGTQGYEPMVMYVNGEYWGLYNLRHAYCKQHFEEWNGAVEDDIDYVKLSPDDGNHFEVQEGDFSAMWNIMQYMIKVTADGTMSDEEYARVEAEVDIDDMIDFHIVNIFLGNNDWMSNGNNMGFWRNRSGTDRRWHFTVYDCDSAMSFGGDSYSGDHIAAATNINDTADNKTKMAPGFLKRCFLNEGFRQRFANRYADLLNTALKVERTTNIVAQAAARVEPEIPRTAARWTNMGSLDKWQTNLATFRKFFTKRPAYQWDDIKDHCGGGAFADITLAADGAGAVKLNTIESGTHFDLPFEGRYFSDIPVTLTATPSAGNEFAGWKIGEDIVSTEPTMTLAPTNGVTIQAVFEAAAANPQQSLRLSEIYGSTIADDPEGDLGEFVIITNLSDQAVSLAGLVLKSENAKKGTVSFERTITDGTVKAHGWAKLVQSSWWSDAKISNGKIKMTLTDSDGVEIQVGNTEFKDEADGGGASMVATTFGNPCNDWIVGPIHDLPPVPPPEPEPEGDVISGDFPNGTNIALTAASTIKIGNATFGGALAISGAAATLELQAGTTATIPTITSDKALTVDGTGTLVMSNATTLVSCAGLTVTNGTVSLTFTGTTAGACAVNLTKSYVQWGGAVTMNLISDVQVFGFYSNTKDVLAQIHGGTFATTIDGGDSSATFKMKKGSNDVKFDGGTITVNLAGVAPRFVNTDGKLDLDGAEITIKTVGDATDARVFKSVKAMTVSDGVITGKASGAGSEIFSADNKIKVTGGVVSVEAADDCFSAATNITVSAGKVQALSTAGDAIDSNGDVEITGGYVFANAVAEGCEGIEADGNLAIRGGSVVAVGYPGVLHAPDAGSVACYTNANIASIKKYVVLTSDCSNRLERLSVNLNKKRSASGLSLLAVVPNMLGTYEDTDTKPSDDTPKGEKLDKNLDGVFVTTVEKTPVEPGAQPEMKAKTEEEAQREIATYSVQLTTDDITNGVTAAMLKMEAVPVTNELGEVTGYKAQVAVNPAVVPQPAVGEDEKVDPLVITPDGEGKTEVSVGIVNATKGLWYGYEVCNALGDGFANDVPSFNRASGSSITVTGSKRSGASAFFRVKVLPAKPTR